MDDLLKLVAKVSSRVLWKTSGREEALVGMEHHSIEPLPDESLSIGLAVARSATQLSVRVSVVIHASGVYARADTATTYEWEEEVEVSDECARELLRRDGVPRALATSCAHVVEAAMIVGADVENPALRFQQEVIDMVDSDSVFE
ncbi:hypothetical protein G6031_09425 [Dietzia sp. CQ4]|uniref:hypothetical protein n=1 Tax=Dietzia sp. (strain CQ4) TaxID=370437 RepID=UPI0015F9E327|nr:hypothetical protein [Dietzia sp. CQ4]MBB1034607.1 hypothetical protein [Dietzia sp. CQ4]